MAASSLLDCVRALQRQTVEDLEAVVIDNSGSGAARARLADLADRRVKILDNQRNTGFGAAVNQAWRHSRAPYLATLNDDATPDPGWLAALLDAIEAHPDAGMCASQVRLAGRATLDSAGMLVARDGSSKQRGQLASPEAFSDMQEVLLPSGSAALYRRALIEEIGGFDDDFFLYCEDTDLGLRARWAGWKCLYVPAAVVDHAYSGTSGAASPLKAYYVERNRLFVLVKNFPAGLLAAAPLVSLARYAWHLAAMLRGRGAAGRYRGDGNGGATLVWIVLRAHAGLIANFASLWRKRRAIRRSAKISPAAFTGLLRAHAISARQVAEL